LEERIDKANGEEMFEIKHRDAMARIASLEAGKRRVETPLLLPVVNPRIRLIAPGEIMKMGFQGIITNSYLIYKDEELRKEALNGLHRMLGFDGLIMTDSGSYQLYSYGRVEAEPREIVAFQDAIGSDIGVILDVPSSIKADRREAEAELEETLRRAEESISLPRRMLLAGTVQGAVYPELRERAAAEMAKLGFDLYPIGGVVPLMENYMFPELVKVVMACKRRLPVDKPVHLFGCGHPMLFALAVACGCDIFDSAAYSLYARDGRYITPQGTRKLAEMRALPCSCEVCSAYTPKELQAAEERETLLARHNLYVSLEEMKRVKESIYDGSLLELVEQRARGHPSLLEALRVYYGYELVERYDPLTKRSAFFYSGHESLLRPEVKRHVERLSRLSPRGKVLVLLPEAEKPYSKTYGVQASSKYHLCVLSPVFGIIPLEIEDVYPLSQHEAPATPEPCQFEHMVKIARAYAGRFKEVMLHSSLAYTGLEGDFFDALEDLGLVEDLREKAKSMADYQFGPGAGEALFSGSEIEKAKTGRIRRAVSEEGLIATFRASDGFVIPTLLGAGRLLRLPFPRNRVVVKGEATEFVRSGKSVFAKFVVTCDGEIRPYQEVVLVDEDDGLLGTGRALLNAEEMLAFQRGIAVKTRHHP
jgi:7-cyano-7-deazaguanine tRNA-ribosyltransferase